MHDDLGKYVAPRNRPRRVVSLVPSLTDTIAATKREVLIGATDWCVHPADLDVVRVRGTKNPNTDRIVELSPDAVVANDEENRGADLQRLRDAGIPVWVTAPTTVPEAIASLRRMLAFLELTSPAWLDETARVWASPMPTVHSSALIPIWRRPWMALGRGTFAGDMLARLGVRNVLADADDRYPRIKLDELPAHEFVVLPDEPYAFSPEDGPEAFPGVPCACISGRHLTWYGPSLLEARDVLTAQLAATTVVP